MTTLNLLPRCGSRRPRLKLRWIVCCLATGNAILSASTAVAGAAFELNDAQMDRVTAAGASGATAIASALGDPSLTMTSTTASVSGGQAVELSLSGADATAAGSEEALTVVTASALSGEEASGVTSGATGYASGENALASSTVSTRSISTQGVDVTIGIGHSTATGSETDYASASVEPFGDFAVSQDMAVATPVGSMARAVGVAIDVNAR